jgi:hypothetical protein
MASPTYSLAVVSFRCLIPSIKPIWNHLLDYYSFEYAPAILETQTCTGAYQALTTAMHTWKRVVRSSGLAGFEHFVFFLETFRLPVVNFCRELPYFAKLRWVTLSQILRRTRCNACLSKDAKLKTNLRCIRFYTQHGVGNSDWFQ